MRRQRYYIRAITESAWQIIDRETGQPIYDDTDKPIVFRDIDEADECVARLNEQETE